MVFPATILSQGIEMYIGGSWVDITSSVYSRDPVSISRGKPNEGSKNSEPSRLSFTLNNRSSNWSPRNPLGAYYGQIGRNAKVRSWVENGEARLRMTSGVASWDTPDSAGISITGDIDVRADVSLATWRPLTYSYIGAMYKAGSYTMFIGPDGQLWFGWTAATVVAYANSVHPIPGATTGRKSVRVTLDVNNGAGGHTANFYYSDDDTMDGTWVQFGHSYVGAGTTSIDDTANSLRCYMSSYVAPGEVYETRIYNGIAGTKRASPKFLGKASGTTSFIDAEGNTWSDILATGATLDNRHYRTHVEVSYWPSKSDRSGNDVYVDIEAQGMTRRLGQGVTPIQSAMRRGIPSIGSGLIAYWPLEDGEHASTLTPGVSNCPAGRTIGAPDLASYSKFVASDDVVAPKTGKLYFDVPYYANTDEFQVRFMAHIKPAEIPDQTVLMRIRTNSSLGWIDFIYGTGDLFNLKTYTSLGVLSRTTAALDLTSYITDHDVRFSLEFKKNGTGVDLRITALVIGETSGITYSETNASITLGSCSSIYVNPNGIDLGDMAIGHLTVERAITSIFDSANTLERAYQGEKAGSRISRMCTESGIACKVYGDSEGSEYLGWQKRSDILFILREAETVDGGFLTERRDADSMMYRTRESIANQPARVTLSYAGGVLQAFDPTDDDQRTRNRFTATRNSGQSATVEDTDSALSTYDPPTGIGLYDDSETLSLYSDGQAAHQAGWMVRLGTVDAPRLPQVKINLAHPDIASDQTLVREILSLDCGDRIEITNPPSWIPPEVMGLIVQGYSEVMSQYEHSITFNCSPSAPYRLAFYDGHPDTLARFSNENTTTSEVLDTTETGVDIVYSYGPDWTHDDGDCDIMIGGERMTVTGVSGSGGAQTLTVTRSVNGIVKSHATGLPVKLLDPTYYMLGASPASGVGVDIDSGRPFYALDYSLPDPIAETGNGSNVITAASFAALPTFPVNVYITNPHPRAKMLCHVGFGAWASSSTGDVRIALRVERGAEGFISPGVGLGASVGYGEIPATAITTLTHIFTTCTVELDPSPNPYIFQIYAMRSGGSGTQDVRYPTVRIAPLRFTGI